MGWARVFLTLLGETAGTPSRASRTRAQLVGLSCRGGRVVYLLAAGLRGLQPSVVVVEKSVRAGSSPSCCAAACHWASSSSQLTSSCSGGLRWAVAGGQPSAWGLLIHAEQQCRLLASLRAACTGPWLSALCALSMQCAGAVAQALSAPARHHLCASSVSVRVCVCVVVRCQEWAVMQLYY